MGISNMFDDIAKDTVTLVKKDGSRAEGLKAVVQSHEVTVFDNSLDVEEGDKIERRFPNGRIESYLILDTVEHWGRSCRACVEIRDIYLYRQLLCRKPPW